MFPLKFGIKIFRSFPQFECVTLYTGLANFFLHYISVMKIIKIKLTTATYEPSLDLPSRRNLYFHKGLDCILS